MKNLKDYIHLYIGCTIQYPDIDDKIITAKLTGVSRADGVETTYLRKKKDCSGDYLSWKPNGHHNSDALHVKLILRPLSDMTDEELSSVAHLTHISLRLNAWTPENFQYFLSKGFDLFGLIDAGLAVDATKLKTVKR